MEKITVFSTTYQLQRIFTQQHYDRFMWFCDIDPRMISNDSTADLSYLINHYKSLGAKGIGETSATIYADDPMMDNLFYHAAQCDMPMIIHISPVE